MTPYDRLLTETELEFMQVIWNLGQAAVNDVREQLAEQRELAYTSVATILRILEKKGVLASAKDGRRHVYRPLMTRDQYEEKSLQHLLSNVFSESKTALVRRLVDSQQISHAELDELRGILDKETSQ